MTTLLPRPLLASLADPGTGGEDRHAVRVGDEALTRSELIAAAAAVADEITGATSVAIDATASIETVVAVTGCLMAGVPAVPVPPDSGPAERNHILKDSGAQLWLGGYREDVALPSVLVDARARSSSTHREPDPGSTAMIMYTSGTTGAPKGVVLSRSAVAAGLDGLAEAWAWSPDDTLVHGLPLFHVHGLILGVVGALRHGSPLVHTVRPTPESYAAAGGSLYFGVPTVWSRVCADESVARALGSARLLVSGSAPLPVPVFERMRALTGSAPIERYGMSETIITLSTRFDGERRPGWVGLPLRGVAARLRDQAGNAVPHDGETLGQLEIAGPTLFDGYLGNFEKTAESMTDDGWFKTGDIAVVDEQGFHRIVGRESIDMIKSGGYRIGAGEVEQALLNHPDVQEAAVVGVPDDDLGQRIVAYVVGDCHDHRELSNFVAQTLSIHKRPREIRAVDVLPRNAMGKVQKKLLVDDYRAGR
ncbi:acyl-CoA synthetase [Prescottella agglutinans]|uniref:Fatty acid CoA ligase FadD36 n=1 Tax=Prescottella agglutinans TaxID=1644129 RepID=A0ABT6MDE2_9NOCA|nr:acyl-CoA synthetase [Prescottella agglutinans]MDH6282326.1 fatty acid CoA ligase FadD36 [Prescottella agglutinans]